MSAPVAQRLIDEHGVAHVAPRLGNYGCLLESGDRARHRSALLVDVISDAANPSLNTGEMAPPSPPPRAAPPAGSYMPTLDEASRSDVSLEAQVDAAQKTLQVLWRERLPVSEHALLRMGLSVSQPDVGAATRAATIAKTNDPWTSSPPSCWWSCAACSCRRRKRPGVLRLIKAVAQASAPGQR